MKINGKNIPKRGIEVAVFPRKEGDIVFKAKPVDSFDDFEKLCPRPLPPKKLFPGGQMVEDVESADFKKALYVYAEKRSNWMIMQSLSATEGLEWETVNMSDSETWKNYIKELEDIGLSTVEMNMLFTIIQTACGLTQDKIDEATDRFLAGQAV